MKGIGSDELLAFNADSDLSSDYQRLHLTMRELASQRQIRTGIQKKARWALYEKKRFDRMIEDVAGFTSQLVDLFPAVQEHQRMLCKTEVSAISKTEDLILWNNVAYEDDKILAAEVKKEMNRRGHTFTDWKDGGSSKMWAGDDNAIGLKSKSHTFAKFELSDNADIRLGN